jgi:hydroxymethylbilane synthase
VGQGALGIECRGERADVIELLRPLNNERAASAVRAERAVSRTLGASCVVPLAAYAEVTGDEIRLRAYVGAPDGSRSARAEVSGDVGDAEKLGIAAARALEQGGAAEILARVDLPAGRRP